MAPPGCCRAKAHGTHRATRAGRAPWALLALPAAGLLLLVPDKASLRGFAICQPQQAAAARLRVARRAGSSGPGELRFLLARHGQTTFNAEKRFQGCLDKEPVLTEKGIAQARELGTWLQRFGARPGEPAIEAVFTSPLLRARQTLEEARTVADGLPEAKTLPELREIDLYEWEGQTQAEIKAADNEGFRLWKERAWELRLGADRPVVQDLWDRAALAWRLMREAVAPGTRLALIVAHGTLGKAMLSTALGLPVQAFRHFSLRNGEVVEVAWPAAPGAAARWRRRHPAEGPWTSAEEEAEALASSQGVGSVDIA